MYDRTNPRHRINMQYAGRYAALEPEAALKQAHDDFLCVGHTNCPHCQADGVVTYTSVDKTVAWRAAADVKHFYFEVFQDVVSRFMLIEVHPCFVGEWWVKSEAKLGLLKCEAYSWQAEPHREARSWATSLWTRATGAPVSIQAGDRTGRTLLTIRDISTIAVQP